MSKEALQHVHNALAALSIEAQNCSTGRKFDMCLAEDIDRVNRQLPSPWIKGVEEAVREAWVELKMAAAALEKTIVTLPLRW